MKTRITSESGYGDKKVTIYQTEVPNAEAQFAMALVERFGLVAGAPDGEDSTGRQKLQVLPVAEVVARAFDLSRATFDAAREAGWMVQVPDLNDINADVDADRAAKAKKRDNQSA
jgi:hypothetical protein